MKNLLLTLAIALAAFSAQAQLITVNYTAVIDNLTATPYDSGNILDSNVDSFTLFDKTLAMNDMVTGSFTYEASALKTDAGGSDSSATYNALMSYDMTFGDFSYAKSMTDNGVTITNDDPSFFINDAFFTSGHFFDGDVFTTYSMYLLSQMDVFSSTALPTELVLSDFTSTTFSGNLFTLDDPTSYYWRAALTELSSETTVAQAVPNAPTAALMFAGGLLLFRRRAR